MFLDDIKYALKKHQTALPYGVKLGGVRIFASVNVRDEIPRKIEELMPQWGIEPQEALRVGDGVCSVDLLCGPVRYPPSERQIIGA